MNKQKNKYGDPLRLGVDIAQKDFENHSGIRNEHDDDAEFYSSLSQMAGPKPRGAAAAFAGLTEGLAHGAKKNSTAKKQEALSKYDRVMDYFRTQNMEMEKKLQWERQKEQEAETLRPYAVGGLETAYSGMPYEQGNQAMRNIFEQLKVNNPKIKGDYLGYIPNSPLINIRDENGKDTVVSLSSFAGEDVSKRVQEEYIGKQKLNIEKEYAPIKYDAMARRTEAAEERTKQMAQKHYMTALDKYAPKIEAAGRVRVVAHKMKDLVTQNPGMFQSVLAAVWNSDDPGVVNNIARQLTNGKNAEAIKEMGKYIQELKINVIKGLAKPNQAIDMIAAGTIPGKGMPDNSIIKILGDLDYKAEHEMNLNKDYLNSVKGAFGQNENGGDVYKQKAEEYMAGATKPAMPDNLITVRDPNTGEQDRISTKDLDAAIALGLEQVGEINAD